MGKQTRRIWRGFLVMMKFPKGALYHWVQWVRFCPAKWKGKVNLLCLFFCFSKKKGLASVYERHNESSIISLWKPLFCIWFQENFNYRALLLLRRHERSECHFCLCFCFLGFGACPNKAHRVGIFHGSGKVPSVCPCSMLLKSLVFLRHLQKLPLT